MAFRVRLQFTIAAAFALAMIPLLVAVVGYVYHSNSTLALETAAASMDQASRDIAGSIDSLLTPVVLAAETTAAAAKTDHSALRRVAGLRFFHRQVERLPQVYSFFIGFESDGAFYQVVRPPPGTERFGPGSRPLDPETRYVLRLLDASSGARADSYIHLAGWSDVRGVDRGPSEYDPRRRPWYAAASAADEVVFSDIYLFASTGRPGLTVSRRVTTDSDLLVGVVGIDLTLDSLAAFLERKKVGGRGRVFLIDDKGRLVARSGAAPAKAALTAAEQAEDPVIAQAARRWREGAGERFEVVGADGVTSMVSLLPFTAGSSARWLVGVVADQSEFTGPIARVTTRILVFGGCAVALALLAIQFLAQRLARPLRLIAGEAARIRDFELEHRFELRSRILEVSDLADTVASMKTSLRNFGVYVPKDLVRSIVASGREVRVGGERRPLTILFTDIEGFTNRSEHLDPEQVLGELSRYFEGMSRAIHRHRGTVDKFIGDAVMALWNAPTPDPDHAVNACRAVLDCQRACEELNARHAAGGLFPLVTRFGLHCGEVMVGNAGAEDRMQYTVLGAAVNLASRIEGLNKRYGTRLLVSQPVVDLAGDRFLFRHVDLVSPAGTRAAVAIHELVGERGDDALGRRVAEWEAAMAAWRERRWAEAEAAFRAWAGRHGEDRLAAIYLARCAAFIETPPPADWDGVQSYDQK